MKSNVSLKTVYEAGPCREEWDKFLAWALKIPYRWEEQMGKCVLDGIKESHSTWYQFFLEKGLVDEEPKRREVDWRKFSLLYRENCVSLTYGTLFVLNIEKDGLRRIPMCTDPELIEMLDCGLIKIQST